MKIQLLRFCPSPESTLGQVYIDNKPECFSLEDEYRKVKVKGDTRIPAGTYEIKFNESLTPLTKKYRGKYPWFTYHLEIQNVNNFKNVYIHIGNTDDHTDACVLVGDTLTNNQYQDGFLGNSTKHLKDFIKRWEII